MNDTTRARLELAIDAYARAEIEVAMSPETYKRIANIAAERAWDEISMILNGIQEVQSMVERMPKEELTW